VPHDFLCIDFIVRLHGSIKQKTPLLQYKFPNAGFMTCRWWRARIGQAFMESVKC
jgi:hypothetical protein